MDAFGAVATYTTRNMARFYALSIEPTLFGDVCLTRRWGRIGTRGQMKAMSFPHEDEALAQFVRVQRQKASPFTPSRKPGTRDRRRKPAFWAS